MPEWKQIQRSVQFPARGNRDLVGSTIIMSRGFSRESASFSTNEKLPVSWLEPD